MYIESVSRFYGPSLTGRLMRRAPGIRTFTQHPGWATQAWPFEFSLLDDYTAVKLHSEGRKRLKVFVTLGTIKPYRFDRLIEQLIPFAGSVDFTWQTGATERHDLPGTVYADVPMWKFERLVQTSDVIVSHAGVGTALLSLDAGKLPLLVPRRMERNEHVDDHQEQVASYLSNCGLALVREAQEITLADLYECAQSGVVTTLPNGTAEGMGDFQNG